MWAFLSRAHPHPSFPPTFLSTPRSVTFAFLSPKLQGPFFGFGNLFPESTQPTWLATTTSETFSINFLLLFKKSKRKKKKGNKCENQRAPLVVCKEVLISYSRRENKVAGQAQGSCQQGMVPAGEESGVVGRKRWWGSVASLRPPAALGWYFVLLAFLF